MSKAGPHLAGVIAMILVDDKDNKQHCKVSKNLGHPVLHREDGPALDYANTYKAHYKNGVLHGTIEFAGKVCSTWNKGVRIS